MVIKLAKNMAVVTACVLGLTFEGSANPASSGQVGAQDAATTLQLETLKRDYDLANQELARLKDEHKSLKSQIKTLEAKIKEDERKLNSNESTLNESK